MPRNNAEHPKNLLSGRYRTEIPVVRPIPARGLIAGLSCAVLALTLFGFYGEYARKEVVSAYVAPRGGEQLIVAPFDGVLDSLSVQVGTKVSARESVGVVSNRSKGDSGEISALTAQSLSRQKLHLEAELAAADVESTGSFKGLQSKLSRLEAAHKSAKVELAAKSAIAQRMDLESKKMQVGAASGVVSGSAANSAEASALQARADAAAAMRTLTSIEVEMASARAELEVAPARNDVFKAQKRREIEQVDLEMARTQTQFSQAVQTVSAGSVSAVYSATGQGVRAGQPLAAVWPQNAPAEIVLRVPSKAIGAVSIGKTIHVRLDAYPFETYGHVVAQIYSVDAAPLPDTSQGLFIQAKAKILAHPEKVALRGSLVGTALVEVDRRTLLGWMLWPLLKNFLS